MARSDKITLDRVQARLKRIKAKWSVPPDEVTYGHLKSLYLLHRKFGVPKKGNPIREYFEAEYRKLHRNTTKSFFRVMVTQTIPNRDPDQYKSLYSNALQYAFDKDIPTAELIDFLKSNGGYKECARLYQKVNPKRGKRATAKKHK